MKLKTLIIDDEPVALAKLESYIKNIPFLELVAKCQGSSEALDFMAGELVDLIFTDIDMPDINGITFVESLTTGPMVVFITAHRDYAIEGFRLQAIDYLTKPYREVDLIRAANKAYELYRQRLSLTNAEAAVGMSSPATLLPSERKSLFVKVETRYEHIKLEDIKYIKGYGEYLQIFLVNATRPLLTLSSFQSMKDKLDSSFLQVHRSYIVNTNRISRIEKGHIIMDADTIIPISSGYRDEFLDYVQLNSVGKAGKKEI